ncbi:Protein FAR1-RELATED SEQUENCE 7 [Platanthera zijinensis]|uniref:Protein FAR1-RELATED SEQUENCE n=1 Tax=Platanthera zijinensis TaxID=2320716 RepID=A0AAP0GEX5_9ASPA
MAVAIERVMTKTRHRLCQWHISKKAPSKVPSFNHDRVVRTCFYNCMNKCDGEDEFNRYWHEMIEKGCLHENRWLKDLHNIRRKWSTTFNKDVLDLGILSTQRSESANNCLHGCSKPTSALVECFSGMEKLVSSWRRNERDEDYKCKQGDVCLRYKVSFLLKQTSKQYSRKMFAFFEKNFMVGVLGVNVVDENKYDERNILYITMHNDPADGDKRWFVSYDSVTNQAQCSCRGFETKGLLCSHILRIYNLKNVRQIPGSYVLKRFSMKAKKDIYLPESISSTNYDSDLIFRNELMRFSYDLARRVEGCTIAKEHVVSSINVLSKQIDHLIDDEEKQRNNDIPESEKVTVTMKDPPLKRPKGVSNARMKAHWERGRRQTRITSSYLLFNM